MRWIKYGRHTKKIRLKKRKISDAQGIFVEQMIWSSANFSNYNYSISSRIPTSLNIRHTLDLQWATFIWCLPGSIFLVILECRCPRCHRCHLKCPVEWCLHLNIMGSLSLDLGLDLDLLKSNKRMWAAFNRHIVIERNYPLHQKWARKTIIVIKISKQKITSKTKIHRLPQSIRVLWIVPVKGSGQRLKDFSNATIVKRNII